MTTVFCYPSPWALNGMRRGLTPVVPRPVPTAAFLDVESIHAGSAVGGPAFAGGTAFPGACRERARGQRRPGLTAGHGNRPFSALEDERSKRSLPRVPDQSWP